jgi:hypothetical protein
VLALRQPGIAPRLSSSSAAKASRWPGTQLIFPINPYIAAPVAAG